MTSTEISTNIRTLGDVLSFMAPFAGGSVPTDGSDELADWIRWIQNKQEEYAKRAFWRRCLTREEFTLTDGDETGVLPDRFNRPNALFMFIVDEIDWNDPDNTDGQSIFVEFNNDFDGSDFAKWQMRYENEIEEDATAIIWYFANPPTPQANDDVLVLPGDMIGYSALGEYFRTTGAEGSQDEVEASAENRFTEYLTVEMIPDKSELLSHRYGEKRIDRLATAKSYYRSRTNRNFQT